MRQLPQRPRLLRRPDEGEPARVPYLPQQPEPAPPRLPGLQPLSPERSVSKTGEPQGRLVEEASGLRETRPQVLHTVSHKRDVLHGLSPEAGDDRAEGSQAELEILPLDRGTGEPTQVRRLSH